MAERHPYIASRGAVVKSMQQFRKTLPSRIDADVLKKLSFAPKNESYLINVLKFIGVMGEDGTPTPEAKEVFHRQDDVAFAEGLASMIEKAYADLFDLHKEDAWNLDSAALMGYFRQADQTTAIVGKRQASTFQVLASLAGHGDLPSGRTSVVQDSKRSASKRKGAPSDAETDDMHIPGKDNAGGRDFGLSVRIEINLPVAGDQATYDRIFKSIRDNLLDG